MTGADKCGPAFSIYNAQDESQMIFFYVTAIYFQLLQRMMALSDSIHH